MKGSQPDGRIIILIAIVLSLTSTTALAIEFATGLSSSQSPAEAAAQAAAQLKVKLGDTTPDVIIICEDITVTNINNVLNAIGAEFPGTPVFGRGDYWWDYDPYNETGAVGVVGDQDGGMALCAIADVNVTAEYVTGVDSFFSEAILRAKGQELAGLINPLPADTKLVLLFGDLHAQGAQRFIPGMTDILGTSFPLVCGSQNDWTPYIYHDGLRITDPAQVIVLGGDFGVSFTIAQGSSPSHEAVEADAAQRALDAVPGGMTAKALIWFNCASRRGSDLQAHIEAVRAVVGEGFPIFGAFSGAEAGKANNQADITIHSGVGVFALVYDCQAPVITPNGGGVFVDPVMVTLSVPGAVSGGTIRYTTDGSEPTAISPAYISPFELTASTTVKARNFAADASFSEVVTAEFTIDTAVTNDPPQVYAGGFLIAQPPDYTVSLNGSVIDYTLPFPPGAVLESWSVIEGPNQVIFDDANSPTTTAVFTGPGEYLLLLTADDGEFAVSDDVPVFVPAAVAIDVVNGSFELDNNGDPNTTKRDFDEVLGWTSGLDQGSGIETIEHPTDPSRNWTGTGDGLMKSYGKYNSSSGLGDWFYQILSHSIEAGNQYKMTFAYGPTTAGTPIIASFIDGSTMAEIADVEVVSNTRRVFADYTLNFIAQPGAGYLGHNLGIKFEVGPGPYTNNWVSVDNVRGEYTPGAEVITGDLTGDNYVDAADVCQLAEQWLWSGTPGAIVEDIITDGRVDLIDFAALADNWLDSGN